jgi:hypothetical protein
LFLSNGAVGEIRSSDGTKFSTKFSMYVQLCTVELIKTRLAHRAARQPRVAVARGFGSLPSLDPDPGHCGFYTSAGSSKIKIWTSSCSKANLALLHAEVKILIFDDPAELWKPQSTKFCSSQIVSTHLSVHTGVCSSK